MDYTVDYGIPIRLNRWVEPQTMLRVGNEIILHGSARIRGRKSKRPHGRTNGAKRAKYHGYYYSPIWDKIKNGLGDDHVLKVLEREFNA